MPNWKSHASADAQLRVTPPKDSKKSERHKFHAAAYHFANKSALKEIKCQFPFTWACLSLFQRGQQNFQHEISD